jgi:RPA family protein
MSEFKPIPPILLYIFDVIEGTLAKEGEEQYSRWILSTMNGEKIYKIRINGILVDTYYSSGDETKKAFASLTVDDGTDTIRIKAWEETADLLNTFKQGEHLDIIGRPRESEGEIYLLPDQVIKIESFDKELYLRLKKAKRYLKKGLMIPTETEVAQVHDSKEKELIWSIISNTEEAIHFDEICKKSKLANQIVQSILNDLIDDGVIYQPQKLQFKKV